MVCNTSYLYFRDSFNVFKSIIKKKYLARTKSQPQLFKTKLYLLHQAVESQIKKKKTVAKYKVFYKSIDLRTIEHLRAWDIYKS